MLNKTRRSLVTAFIFIAVLIPVVHAQETPTKTTYNLKFGLSIGPPGIVNFELAKSFNDSTGVRVNGGYLGGYSGIQVGYVPVWKKTGNFYRDVAVIAGHFRWLDSDYHDKYGIDRYNEWNYAGLETLLQWRRIFVAPAITAGKGNWDTPLLFLRIGGYFN